MSLCKCTWCGKNFHSDTMTIMYDNRFCTESCMKKGTSEKSQMDEEFERMEVKARDKDIYDNFAIEPQHYTSMNISPLEYIKANDIGWNLGNVIKYVSRYKNKNGIEDLKKARWYLNDIINDLE